MEKQFHPFYHGFLLVTRDSSLRKLFRPDEIDLLVAGSQLLDFNQLASAAEYDGGYTSDSATIRLDTLVDTFREVENYGSCFLETSGALCRVSPTNKNGSFFVLQPEVIEHRTSLSPLDANERVRSFRIGGLARLKLIISRNGPDTDRLPTAHTCFNAFLLPDYSSMDKLREKLLIAINNAEGFGLL